MGNLFILLCKALADSLDGCETAYQIHGRTGLPLERCEELLGMLRQVPEYIRGELLAQEHARGVAERWEAFKAKVWSERLNTPEYVI